MIWRYYLNLVYCVLDKLLKFYHIVFFLYSHPTKTYDSLDGNFSSFKFFVKNPHIYEVIPIELFFDMKNLQKFVKVAHKIMLENLAPFNVYF